MPYKSEKINITNTLFDRRRKVLPQDYENIKKLYASGLTMKSIAIKYNVSRYLIAIIVKPERAEYVKQRVKNHWKDYEIKGEEHNKIMREYRKYKQKLFLENKIKLEEQNNG